MMESHYGSELFRLRKPIHEGFTIIQKHGELSYLVPRDFTSCKFRTLKGIPEFADREETVERRCETRRQK
jgi:hypothetical protein